MDPTTLLILQLLTQFKTSAIIVWLLQKVKASQRIPWITRETARINRIVAVAASMLAAVGIHFSFNHQAGVLTVSGLTLASITAFAGKWLTGYISQELMYQAIAKNGNGAGAAKTAAAVAGKA